MTVRKCSNCRDCIDTDCCEKEDVFITPELKHFESKSVWFTDQKCNNCGELCATNGKETWYTCSCKN